MNKLSKNVLKKIVKECLVEILAEGLVSNSNKNSTRKKRKLNESIKQSYEKNVSLNNLGEHTQSYKNKNSKKKPSYLDQIRFNNKQKNEEPQIQSIPKNISSDPIMQDILSDTAQTTLREQSSASSNKRIISSKSTDKASMIVDQSDPSELFGESSKNWAMLAFS